MLHLYDPVVSLRVRYRVLRSDVPTREPFSGSMNQPTLVHQRDSQMFDLKILQENIFILVT